MQTMIMMMSERSLISCSRSLKYLLSPRHRIYGHCIRVSTFVEQIFSFEQHKVFLMFKQGIHSVPNIPRMPQLNYNPITAMGFLAIFLDYIAYRLKKIATRGSLSQLRFGLKKIVWFLSCSCGIQKLILRHEY